MPTTDPARILPILEKVSRANLERDVKYLSTAWPNRNTMGKYLDPAADWIAARMRSLKAYDVGFHAYPQAGKRLRNVTADKSGKGPQTIIVCAHYDSRQQKLMDPDAPAPGANDNGTGVAVLLEAARVLAPLSLTDRIRFVFFSGEEQGLWGSAAYAPIVKAQRLNVHFVLNVDEVGFPPPDRALFVDRDEGGKPENNAASAALVDRIVDLAKNVVKVPTRIDPAYDSDYMPFENQGFVITGLYEAGEKYPQYHTDQDTFDRVDFAYVHDMARLAVATLLSEGGLL